MESKEQRVLNVWNKRKEVEITYFDYYDTGELKQGYDVEKLNKLCEQENIEIEDFIKYGKSINGEK